MSRPRNKLRDAYAQRYSLSPKRTKLLVPGFIEQLERCKDDDARNVLLGIGAELQEKRARQLGRLA